MTDEPAVRWIMRSDLLPGLGSLVMNSSALNDATRYVINAMSPYDEPSRLRSELLIEGLGERQMIERAERMAYAILEGPLQDDVVAWLSDVELARRDRNTLMHSSWSDGVSTKDGELGVSILNRRIKKPSDGFKIEAEEQTPAKLNQTNDTMSALYLTGLKLMTELHEFSKQESLGVIGIPWRRDGPRPA